MIPQQAVGYPKFTASCGVPETHSRLRGTRYSIYRYITQPLPGWSKCLVFVGPTAYIISFPAVPTGKITGKRWYLVKRQWFELIERLKGC